MTVIINLFGWIGRSGRAVLVAGLAAGILLPDVAAAMKPYLPELVAFLLFVAALRIGPRETLGNLRQAPETLAIVLVFQIGVPLTLFALFQLTGFAGTLAFAIVLMASASSISGGANLTILTGNDGAPALRLLIVGTALLPLTVIPVFWIMPELGSPAVLLGTSFRLLVIIAASALTAFLVRGVLLKNPDANQLLALDGLSALTMAVVVVGLMSAIGPTLSSDPWLLLQTLFAACVANFGLQFLFWGLFRQAKFRVERAAYSIIGGNRNMALFLAALPLSITDPILLFIGAYQIPMYLTPLVLGWLYRKPCSQPPQ